MSDAQADPQPTADAQVAPQPAAGAQAVPAPAGAQVGSRPTSAAQIILEMLYALLALGSVILFGLRLGFDLDPEFEALAVIADRLVCSLFILKATWDIWKAPNRRQWWKWGWADVVASIPDVEALRAFRGLRLMMMVRVMRSTTRSVRGVVALFDVERTKALVAVVFALIVVSVVAGSFLVLGIESAHPDANIRTAEAAFLWTISTLIGAEPTGFGDHFPVSTGGRIVAIWLVTLSLGLIGSLAGLISAWIEDEEDEPKPPANGGACTA